jgi:taurine dioxygenase
MTMLDVRPLEGAFGAEVFGVEPDDLDESTRAALRAAFDEHGLVVFHDMTFSYATQQLFVEMLVGASLSTKDDPELTVTPSAYVSNRENGASSAAGKILFHTDGMWWKEPFELVSLYAVNVEDGASPTIFASMTKAWETLPDELKARVADLQVVQSQGTNRGMQADDEYLTIDPNARGVTRVSPLVQAHPRTGRPTLYVGEQQTREIVELPADESSALLDTLFGHLYRPANLLEHQWSDGDFVAWDNLAVQHARPNVSMDGPARTLRRAVVPPAWLWSGIEAYAKS